MQHPPTRCNRFCVAGLLTLLLPGFAPAQVRQRSAQVEGVVRHERLRRRALHQRLQALVGDALLLELASQLAEQPRGEREVAEVRDEEREITDGELPAAHRLPGEQQHQPRTQVPHVR